MEWFRCTTGHVFELAIANTWTIAKTVYIACPQCGTREILNIPDAVTDAILARFDEPALRELRWDSLNGNYYLSRYGMCIGIEEDGYMHT